MQKLKIRVKNLVLVFSASLPKGKWVKHPFTLEYQNGEYRQEELVRIIRDAVPHFALTEQEIEKYKSTNDFGEIQRVAWSRISKARKDKKGDYGELLLFIILSVFLPAQRFVTKVRLRSSTGEQIKGFDCAHFTIENHIPYLWLGEAKFHESFSTAISSAFASIQEHCAQPYLADEFSILGQNIEVAESSPEYMVIDSLLNQGKNLDSINIRIPVLITYDSPTILKHSDHLDPKYIGEMQAEFLKKYASIESRACTLSKNVEIIFVLLPLKSVSDIKTQLEIIEEANR
jgi:hypothetical protein